ncbi:SRPBCC family protein [Nocardia altamirensis]|uniref:SRPBCC family protein n=1 Tax=Nocardia altamirensis TaxID=472158 RepID=UPI00084073C8|nr:SRPBCC family protein [Nocardia altamirensis]
MASVKKELVLDASSEDIWAIIRDFAAGPVRMAPGYAVDSKLDGPDIRVVDFAGGAVARERLVTIDDDARRFVYSIVGGSVTPAHNNASMQVFPHGDGQSRFVWIHDVLPDELAAPLAAGMDAGLRAFEQTRKAPTPS